MTQTIPYGDLLQESRTTGAAGSIASNDPLPYADLLQKVRLQNSVLAAAKARTSPVNPDQYAEAMKLGQATGIPPAVAARNLDHVRQLKTAQDLHTFATDHPAGGQWMADGDNAAIAHDDTPSLGKIARATAALVIPAIGYAKPEWLPKGAQSAATEVESMLGSALSGIGHFHQAILRRLAAPFGKRPTVADLVSGHKTAPDLSQADPQALMMIRVGDALKAFAQSHDVPEAQKDLIDKFGTLVGTIGLGATAAGPVIFAGQGVDTMHDRAIRAGTEGTAGADFAELGAAPVYAVAAKFAQKVGVDSPLVKFVLGKLPASMQGKFTQYLLGAGIAGTVGAGELTAAQGAFNVESKLGVDQNQDLTEGMAEMAGTGGGISTLLHLLTHTPVHVAAAEHNGAQLDAVMEAAVESKLGKRSPEHLADFIASTSDHTVYLPTEQVAEHYQAKGLDPAGEVAKITGNPDAYMEAEGGQLAIPLADYVTKGQELHAALGDSAKLDAEGLSRAEILAAEKAQAKVVKQAAKAPDTISTKEASMQAARAELGKAPLEVVPLPGKEQELAAARQRMAANPNHAEEVVAKKLAGDLTISAADEATLQAHAVDLTNQMDVQAKRAADPEATPEARDLAKAKFDELSQKFDQLNQATKVTGAAWSHFGRQRMQELLRDYSFGALLRKEGARLQRPLTGAETAKIKEQADRIAQLEAEARTHAEALVAALKPKTRAAGPKKSVDERAQERMRKQIAEVEATIQQRLKACPI